MRCSKAEHAASKLPTLDAELFQDDAGLGADGEDRALQRGGAGTDEITQLGKGVTFQIRALA